jgi:hypothetical protein
VSELGVEAGSYGKEPPDEFQGLPERSRRWIRAKIEGAIFLGAPDHAEGGKLLFHGKPQKRVGLIIPQLDIVTGPVFLDEIIFKDEGLFFGISDNRVNVRHPFQHGQGLCVLPIGLLKIGTHPVLDVPCLADIEDRSLFVLEKVDPGARREMIDSLAGKIFVHVQILTKEA